MLLKNDNEVLPIQEDSGSVCVIGPNAKAEVVTGGGSARLRSLWTSRPGKLSAGRPPPVSTSLTCSVAFVKVPPRP